MAVDLFQDRKVMNNLSETPITDEQIQEKAEQLVQSQDFTSDFTRLYKQQTRSKIAGSGGGIAAMQQHYRNQENRDYGLASDHNAGSVKTHNHGIPDGKGGRKRCFSRTQLFEQRKADFRETTKLAAFIPDGKERLFRRPTDKTIAPAI